MPTYRSNLFNVTVGTLNVSAKRYDGVSGTAIFTGVVPFQVGQVSTGQLTSMSLWNGGTELPISVVDLDLRHSDGSVKAAQIHTSLNAANETEIQLNLRLGVAPSVGTVTPTVIDVAWMSNPRLLACTDADHLCASRIALGPLVSIATLRSLGFTKFADCLDTEFKAVSTFPAYGYPKQYWETDTPGQWPGAFWQNAEYGAIYPVYCHYLCTGDMDWLRVAHGFASWDVGTQYPMNEHSHANEYVKDADTNLEWTVNFDYANPPNTSPNGQPETMTEWSSGSAKNLYMIWAMSGWRQARGAGVAWGLRNIQDASGGQDIYGGRFTYRWFREYGVLLRLYNVNQRLSYTNTPPPYGGGGWTVTSELPSNTAWWDNFYQTNYYDKFETWSLTITPNTDPKYNVWGHANGYNSPDGVPTFQFALVFNTIYQLEHNVYQDDQGRTWNQLAALANYLESNCTAGPYAVGPFGPVDEVYSSPYFNIGTPPTSAGGNNQYTPCMLLPLYAWAWAYTGEQRYQDIVDAMCSHRAWIFNDQGGSAGNWWKQIGEFYEMMFHAAAWRAGVAHDGWDL